MEGGKIPRNRPKYFRTLLNNERDLLVTKKHNHGKFGENWIEITADFMFYRQIIFEYQLSGTFGLWNVQNNELIFLLSFMLVCDYET